MQSIVAILCFWPLTFNAHRLSCVTWSIRASILKILYLSGLEIWHPPRTRQITWPVLGANVACSCIWPWLVTLKAIIVFVDKKTVYNLKTAGTILMQCHTVMYMYLWIWILLSETRGSAHGLWSRRTYRLIVILIIIYNYAIQGQ